MDSATGTARQYSGSKNGSVPSDRATNGSANQNTNAAYKHSSQQTCEANGGPRGHPLTAANLEEYSSAIANSSSFDDCLSDLKIIRAAAWARGIDFPPQTVQYWLERPQALNRLRRYIITGSDRGRKSTRQESWDELVAKDPLAAEIEKINQDYRSATAE